MIPKKASNVTEALKDVQDNMTLLFGGFGLCGIPEKAIEELVRLKTANLTCTFEVYWSR